MRSSAGGLDQIQSGANKLRQQNCTRKKPLGVPRGFFERMLERLTVLIRLVGDRPAALLDILAGAGHRIATGNGQKARGENNRQNGRNDSLHDLDLSM